jgi:hypothetical protein
MTFRHVLIAFAAISFATLAVPSVSLAQDLPKPREIKSIAEEALIYGLPMVMGYGVMYQYAIDDKSANYKAPFNQIYNEAHTFTPADRGSLPPMPTRLIRSPGWTFAPSRS